LEVLWHHDREGGPSAPKEARVRGGPAEGFTCADQMPGLPDNGSGPCGRGSARRHALSDRAGLGRLCGKGLAKVTTYRIHLTRDENGAWIVRSPDVPGFHTYGRSLRQARNRAREALSLWVEDVDDAELEFQYHLPKQWREATRAFGHARTRAIDAESEARALATDVANYLTSACGLSLRDAAELLALSHQRVQQLVADHESHAVSTRSGRSGLIG
jgi:predicted RNase H-like HicB family nuclease